MTDEQRGDADLTQVFVYFGHRPTLPIHRSESVPCSPCGECSSERHRRSERNWDPTFSTSSIQ
jgi:hypothetical protein